MNKLLKIICINLCCCFFIVTGAAAAPQKQEYIRVGLLQGQEMVTISAENDFVIKDIDNNKNYKYDKSKNVTVRQSERKVYIDKKGKETTTLIVAVKNNAPVVVNNKHYRGALIIQPHRAGLTVINRLPLEDYLRGVVAEEMPYSWPKEALKAQAVAARTFALYDKEDKKHAKEGFDVCATTDCQTYGGIASETSATDSAIKATSGQIITYANEPICAVFHAASGGFTENSEDVWSVTVPYLRSVDDSTEQSPYTDWSTQIKIDDLSKTLARQYTNIGTIKEIDTTNFPQGVKKNSKTKVIKFTGSNKKTLELTGTQLRSLLGLKSNNFSLSLIQDKKKLKDSKKLKISKPDKTVLQINGKGLGHRLGMSQWGAKSLADDGRNYKQILQHYYSDVSIKSIY